MAKYYSNKCMLLYIICMYTTMQTLKVHACMIFLSCQYSKEDRAQYIKGWYSMTNSAKNFNLKNSFVFCNRCVTHLCQWDFHYTWIMFKEIYNLLHYSAEKIIVCLQSFSYFCEHSWHATSVQTIDRRALYFMLDEKG